MIKDNGWDWGESIQPTQRPHECHPTEHSTQAWEWLNTWFHPFRGLAIWGILPPWRHLSGDRPLNCCLSVSLLCICLWVDPGFSLCSSVGWKSKTTKRNRRLPAWRQPTLTKAPGPLKSCPKAAGSGAQWPSLGVWGSRVGRGREGRGRNRLVLLLETWELRLEIIDLSKRTKRKKKIPHNCILSDQKLLFLTPNVPG